MHGTDDTGPVERVQPHGKLISKNETFERRGQEHTAPMAADPTSLAYLPNTP